MFLHNLKYELLSGLRSKDLTFWLILFPIILGSFFKIAFSGVYEKDTAFSKIDTAIVMNEDDVTLKSVIDSIEASDQPLMDVTYANKEEAERLLKEGDVKGIIYSGDELSLTVTDKGIEQTILSTFVEKYNNRARIIKKTAETDHSAAEKVAAVLSEDVKAANEVPLTDGNTDNLIFYFYNLIAMVALYGSLNGLNIAKNNQADVSVLGARKQCSPTPKSLSTLASFCCCIIMQTMCMLICVTFLRFVLRVDFGNRLHLVYLAAILGGIVGVSMGFFIGSVGNISSNTRTTISFSLSMIFCFLSGLMISSLKPKIALMFPWFDKLNPAAVIADSFYSLNIYTDYDRYLEKIATMAIMSAVLIMLSLIFTRRKKYASL